MRALSDQKAFRGPAEGETAINMLLSMDGVVRVASLLSIITHEAGIPLFLESIIMVLGIASLPSYSLAMASGSAFAWRTHGLEATVCMRGVREGREETAVSC